jgi:serine/threonine protein kinase
LDKLLFESDDKLTDEEMISLVRGISKGVYHLHKYNIVHRDLAARNILLTSSGEPKISVNLFVSFFILNVLFTLLKLIFFDICFLSLSLSLSLSLRIV